MEQPFDPTVKTLAELGPADWLRLARRRRRRVTIEDSDVGTLVSGASDKLFRVHDDPEYLLHLDFETGHFHAALPLRLKLYNSVFEYRHARPVLSVVVLLKPEADSPQWSGLLERGLPGEPSLSTLRYEVVRVWQVPVEELLTSGFGTLPLAPISNVPQGQVRTVLRRMKERLSGPRKPPRTADLWAATYVLLGLRYPEAFTRALFEEVLGMEESTTYQAIVRKGREEEARRILLILGEPQFGPADEATRAAIESIESLAKLEELLQRLSAVSSWTELLATSRSQRRKGPRKSRD